MRYPTDEQSSEHSINGGETVSGAVRRVAPPMVRRFLTLLFSDLSNSTRLGAVLEAEHYADLLGHLHKAYRSIIARHAGTVVRIQGDGVLAIFGHPDALEDDGRRATEAAIDLHALVRSLRVEPTHAQVGTLTLHTGIHAGLVLLGPGDVVRGRFELMGNAPNIAARLSDAAGPDEILVSEETLGAERHFFVTGSRRELALQGTTQPLAALPIIERARIDNRYEARSQRGLSAFVGRERELAAMALALGEATGGHTRNVVLSAAPGLGKTRLAHEFLHRCTAEGRNVLRGYCEHYRGAQPLQPFLQMVRMWFELANAPTAADIAQRIDDGLAEIDPELCSLREPLLQALLVNEPAVPGRPRRAPQERLSALVKFFHALAVHRPLVLFIDDWQWADDASYQVLAALRAQPGASLLALLATRGFSAGDMLLEGGVERLELQPLSDPEALETAHRLLPTANPFVLREICTYAGGSPLYIEELCHGAAHGPASDLQGRFAGGAVWLHVLIEARVARLPEALVALVRIGAVIGQVIPVWLFERITGCAVGDERVHALATEDLIYPGEQAGTLRFKHGITRDVIYEAVGLHQRKALHLEIAQVVLGALGAPTLSGVNMLESLAYHFDAAGQFADAAHYAELAGDQAVGASALDSAQAQYRAALAALDRLEPTPARADRRGAIMQRLGFACVFDPSRDDLPLFKRALVVACATGSTLAVARAQYWLGYLHYGLGDSVEAIKHIELALQAAAACGDDRLLVQVRATLGQALAAAGRYAPAAVLLNDAISVKQTHRSGAGLAVGLAYSLVCKAYILGDRGEFAQAHECFDSALTTAGAGEHQVGASIRGWCAAVLLWQGRWAEAKGMAVQGRRIGERVRSLFTLSMGTSVVAFAEWQLERNERALQQMTDTLAWLTPRGNGLFTSLTHGWLAEALVSAGRPAEARQHAARALRRGRRLDLIGGAMACRAMARLAASDGHGPHARRWIGRALDIATARGSAHERATTSLCSAEVELALVRPDLAEPLLDAALAGFEAMRMDWHGERARRLRLRL